MANALFPEGARSFAAGESDWDVHKFRAVLVDIHSAGPGTANAWTIASHTNTNVVTVTTAAAHGMTTGDRITIKGATAAGGARVNSTAYGVGAIFTSGGGAFVVTRAGTSAAAPPTFSTVSVGDVTMDGTAAVQYLGTTASLAPFSPLNFGSWDTRGFFTGYWTIANASASVFDIALPTGMTPGASSATGYFADLSKLVVSTFAPSGSRISIVTLADANKTNVGGVLGYNTTLTWTAVTGATVEGVLIARTNNTLTANADAADTAWVPIAWYDSLTNLPVTPNGGDITFTISPNLFTL